MPFLLETNVAFLNSTATPSVCLFSGRMDGIERRPLRISRQVTVSVPMVPSEYHRWYGARMFWLWPVLFGAMFGALVWVGLPNGLLGVPAHLVAIALLSLGVLVAGLYGPVARRDCVRLHLAGADGRVRVIFPSSREHVFWEYLRAYKEYQVPGSWTAKLPLSKRPEPPLKPSA